MCILQGRKLRPEITGDWDWRAGQPTPVFLPGESHGQKNLAGYRVPESDTTEATQKQQRQRQTQAEDSRTDAPGEGRGCVS